MINKKELMFANGIQGVYRIVHTKKNKCYVGSSKNIYSRWVGHINKLNKGEHHSKKLQKSWSLTKDKSVFKFEIIEEVTDNKTLLEIEQKYIDFYDSYNNGYNSIPYTDPTKIMKGNLANKIKKANKQKEIAKESKIYYEKILELLEVIDKTQEESVLIKYQVNKLKTPLKSTSLKYKKLYLFFKWYYASEYCNDNRYFLHVDTFKSCNPIFKIYEKVDGKMKGMAFMTINKKFEIIEDERWFDDGTCRFKTHILIANVEDYIIKDWKGL